MRELYRSYYAFALSGVLTIVGVVGLFLSDARGMRIASIGGLVLGLLVAPFQAFHRMRLQRDAALGSDPLWARRRLGLVNAISGSNWGLDHFAAVNEDGFAARVVVAPGNRVSPEAEFDSAAMTALRDAVARSALEHWFRALPGTSTEAPGEWRLVSPSRGYVTTVVRDAVLVAGGGSELYGRCTAQLPTSFHSQFALLVLDVVARDVPGLRVEGRTTGLAGEPFQPTLDELFSLLETMVGVLVDELAEPALRPIIEPSRRERLLARFGIRPNLRLIGPNLNVRSKARSLSEAIQLPDLERMPGATDDNHLFVETPDGVDVRDIGERTQLLRRGMEKFLRQHEYLGFEPYLTQLGRREVQLRAEELDRAPRGRARTP